MFRTSYGRTKLPEPARRVGGYVALLAPHLVRRFGEVDRRSCPYRALWAPVFDTNGPLRNGREIMGGGLLLAVIVHYTLHDTFDTIKCQKCHEATESSVRWPWVVPISVWAPVPRVTPGIIR